jgi:hypothetical protein
MLAAGTPHARPPAWRIERETRLVINGKANIANISCDIKAYDKADTLAVMPGSDADSIALQGKLAYDIIDFNCKNFFFTAQLRKTLKADQHPLMLIRLVKLDKLPAAGNSTAYCEASGEVEITLAGVTRRFQIPVRFCNFPGGRSVLFGARNFRLEDFNLKGPGKVAGFIRVKNDFKVEFHMALTRIQ